ncbi:MULTISPECIES: ABC transporter permease [Hungatella]|uniref:ABC transporter permease n=1 Tax=Hungatella TaxID=1649459 RepID=UPI0011DD35DE|nr:MULTISPECIES: ABC transporter permease [Hungatella]MCI6452124.1 ABC transporter permease [Hungatella sp.]
MIEYALKYPEKLYGALGQHLMLVAVTLVLSLILAAALTVCAMYFKTVSNGLIHLFSVIYSIPSLAMFAMLIPVTGLGTKTALIVLTLYNQYLLLRNFTAGLNGVDSSVIEAAAGMGMTTMQILLKIRLPLAKRSVFTGIRLAIVSTTGIATIAATINAGGLGTILFDGLRTLNVVKILWGTVLSAGLAIVLNAGLERIERRL